MPNVIDVKKEGIFAIWKPRGPSSNQVLSQIRRAMGTRHVGHAGTLDPLAEGILVVGIGREATKHLHEAAGTEKEYEVKIKLGEESTTDDEEGEKREMVNGKWDTGHGNFPKQDDIEEALKEFCRAGYMQTPPLYSALKISGVRAYRLARKGAAVEMKPRSAEIKSIKIIHYQWPFVSLRIVTGPGVYIRAIARDLGKSLGTGGYVEKLVRTRVGEFTKEKCRNMNLAGTERTG